MPTRSDIIALAHRLIGVLSSDEAATADQDAYGGAVLDAAFAEFQAVQGVTFAWALSATPSAALLPLARLLAAEIAPHYGTPGPDRSRAIAQLRAYAFTDDRADDRDLDESGTVTDAEIDAANAARFY